MIAEKNGLRLYAPRGCADMNYTIIDDNAMVEHLIDICDVYDEEDEEYEENGGLLFADLISLNDIDHIKGFVWRTIPFDCILDDE